MERQFDIDMKCGILLIADLKYLEEFAFTPLPSAHVVEVGPAGIYQVSAGVSAEDRDLFSDTTFSCSGKIAVGDVLLGVGARRYELEERIQEVMPRQGKKSGLTKLVPLVTVKKGLYHVKLRAVLLADFAENSATAAHQA